MKDEDIDRLDVDAARDALKQMVRRYHNESRASHVARQERATARQQILDLGKLLTKHRIDWRNEVEWTAPPPVEKTTT
jgi:hypothetical protein